MKGFVNSHWTNITGMMLEKKKGARQIHILLIISFICPEFNASLKYLIGHLAMKTQFYVINNMASDQEEKPLMQQQ